MDRRKLLKLLSASVAVTSASYGVVGRVLAATNPGQDRWGYSGEQGPTHWSELSPDYQMCSQGSAQSPIDLQPATSADAATLEFDYHPIPLRIANNGHSIQVNCAPGNQVILDGQPFDLVQLHFHHPSEHLMTGKPFPMELHLVHRNAAGALAVVGIFLREGRANVALQPIWRVMPTQKSSETLLPDVRVDLAKLLPEDHTFARYTGSLTTPPCSEGVTWIVMEQPVEISRIQVLQFARIINQNARPIQALNHRALLESR